jgi:hypothetical protein
MLGWIVTLSFSSSPPGSAQDATAEPDELGAQIPVYSETPRIVVGPVAPFAPPAGPAPAADAPVFTALSSIEYAVPGEDRSIIVHRVAPPDLVIPPPPPAPDEGTAEQEPPESPERLSLWREVEAKRRFVALSVTVYDRKLSHIRWTWRDPSATATTTNTRLRVVPADGQASTTFPPPGVIEYEAWFNINWECMRDVLAVEAGGIRHEMLPGIGCVAVDSSGEEAPGSTIPAHP